MAIEIKLLKLYNIKNGDLKAKIKYGNRVHSVKCSPKKNSFISMPIGFTSFEVIGISNYDINQSVTIRVCKENRLDYSPEGVVRIDFTQPQFI